MSVRISCTVFVSKISEIMTKSLFAWYGNMRNFFIFIYVRFEHTTIDRLDMLTNNPICKAGA